MKKIILLTLVFILAVGLSAVPRVIYVAPDGSSSESVDGASWDNAVSLSRARALVALNNSKPEPEEIHIWMKSGTYNLTSSFQINLKITIYGGFSGNEISLSERNWVINQTIFNQTGSATVIWGNTQDDVLLDGLILQGGRPAGGNGCGQIAQGTTLRNCIIRNNKGTGSVGALSFFAVSGSTKKVTLDNCLIINNESASTPAVIAAGAVPADIFNCTIANNYSATGTQAAITNTGSLNVYNSVFYGNKNGSNIAKSLGDNVNKVVTNCAWDFAATNGSLSGNIALSGTPFISATSFTGAANGTTQLASAIESANFRLTTGSTCINTGNNSYATATSDLAGNNRIQNTTVEIGCYEVTPTVSSISGGNLTNTGLTNIQLANTDITISSGEFIADASKTVKSITIAAGAKLTLSSGTLTATNGITLESDATGTATILGSGSLNGTVTAKQYLGSARNWYVSSPISSATSPDNNIAYYYEYMEDGNNTNTIGQPGSPTLYWKGLTTGSTMEVGKGYIAKTNTGTTVQFSGTPNNGDIETIFNLTRNDNKGKGFNLVGNPYPSYIDWTDVAAANPNLDNTYYYRTKNTNITNTYTFVTWNGAGSSYVVSNGSLPSNTTITRYIPPTQAFWVRVKSGTSATKMYFNNTMREHRDDNGNLMKAPKQDTRTSIRLQLLNGSESDELLIYQDNEASNNYDAYDSPKMMNNSSNIPDLYSKAGEEKLVINGLNIIADNMELPLGFSLNAPSTLKFKTTELKNMPEGFKVYLRDKLLNAETELTTSSVYNFNTSEVTTNNENRFSIIFRTAGTSTNLINSEKLNIQVYVNAANQINITANKESKYAIYNAVGQMIENGKIISDSQTSNFKPTTGVYVVKVGNQSTRVILK